MIRFNLSKLLFGFLDQMFNHLLILEHLILHFLPPPIEFPPLFIPILLDLLQLMIQLPHLSPQLLLFLSEQVDKPILSLDSPC